jgi:hypothetical protein
MTTIAGAVAAPRLPAWLGYGVAAGITFLGLVALRAAGLHDGLLYPDGYQYLLMARGIAEHLEPAVTLGQGGDVFMPNADAAVKPLFPALVALVSLLGVSPIDAARAITVLAGAAVPVLTAVLALRLGAGRGAAAVAALLCAVSPTLVYWSGYTGPDPVAQALALGAALTLLHRRPVVGGALAALCVLTRIDYAIVALAVLGAAVAVRSLRREALRAATSGVLVVSAVLGPVRPPVELPPAAAVVGSVSLAALSAALLLLAGRTSGLWAACIAVSMVTPLALLDGGAWASVARQDWPLLVLAVVGFALCLRADGPRSIALRIVALSLPLAVLYWVKNPGLERYVAQLVPELALLAAVGLGTLRRARLPVAVAAAALAAAGVVASSQPPIGVDSFQELAPTLERAPAGRLVTAAPDAYGFLLTERRPIRRLRAGAEGLVLVDGAARAYAPGVKVEGELLRSIPVVTGFRRPDGAIDRAPALLYRGRVVQRR